MHVQEYNFYRIVGTSDKLVKNLLPLIEELRDGERLAYYAFSNDGPSKNVGIVVGILDFYRYIPCDLAYIGYVMGRHGVVPETVTSIDPDIETDLTNPFCFSEPAMF